MSYEALQIRAREWDAIQRYRIHIGNMLGAFDRLDRPYPEAIRKVWLAQHEKLETDYLKLIRAEAENGETWLCALSSWVSETKGLGAALLCVVGLIPPIPEFPNPAKLWAYLGLAVGG